MEFWNYIVENFLLMAIFFVGYESCLKNSKFFTFSRFYFSFGIVFSLVLSFFQYTIFAEIKPMAFLEAAKGSFEEFSKNLTNINSRNSINFETIIFLIYLLISFCFFDRILLRLFQLKKLIITTENIALIKDITITQAPENKGVFSFFNYIFFDKILSQGLANQQLPITSFNQSSIKKRIIMHKKKGSNQLHLSKLSFLILCLNFIFYSCNVDEAETLDESAEFSYYFNRDTSEEELQSRIKMFIIFTNLNLI